jgi:hypothetical protein
MSWLRDRLASRSRRREAMVKEVISEAYRAVVLRRAVQEVRREYLPKPPSGNPDYDHGYGDAILDITRLLDPDFPPKYLHIHQDIQKESDS